MRREWWVVLLAGLLVASAVIGVLVEPWSGLERWFGGEPSDGLWAHVAVGLFAFAALLVLAMLAVTGVPRVLKAFGAEIGAGVGLDIDLNTHRDDAIDNLRDLLRANVDHVQLLGEHLRYVRATGDKERDAISARVDALGAQVGELARLVEDLQDAK